MSSWSQVLPTSLDLKWEKGITNLLGCQVGDRFSQPHWALSGREELPTSLDVKWDTGFSNLTRHQMGVRIPHPLIPLLRSQPTC